MTTPTPQEAPTTPSDMDEKAAEAFRLQSIADFAEDGVHGPIAENIAEVERTAFLAGCQHGRAEERAAAFDSLKQTRWEANEWRKEVDTIRAENEKLTRALERIAAASAEIQGASMDVLNETNECSEVWESVARNRRRMAQEALLEKQAALTTLSPAEGKGEGK